MDKEPPRFVQEILRLFSEKGFRHKFESDTGHPIGIYKNHTELVTAFLLHRERVRFDYGKMYPEHPSERKCEVDFTLFELRLFRQLPDQLNVLNWPPDKPVKYIENKRNVHGKYTPKPREVIEKLLSIEKRHWKAGTHHAFVQREFLLKEGYETFPIGDVGLEWFYYNGLLADG